MNAKLEALLRASVERVKAMSPEARREMHEAQRRSWVTGELMLEHPEMTEDEANRLYDRAREDQP